jgi:hypothetical protein
MTAISSTPGRRPSKTIAVIRTHFANPSTLIIVPLIVIAGILLLNIVVWALIMANLDSGADRAEVSEGLQYSGASSYLFIYMLVVAVQAIAAVLPLSLSYGATRRQFAIGTGLTFVGVAAAYATLLTILAVVEDATGGWWLGGRMFTAVYFGGDAWYERWLVFFALTLVFFVIGAAFATIFQRWRRTGLLLAFATVAVVGIGIVALLTATGTWEASWGWLVDTASALGWVGVPLASLVPIVVIAGLTYLVLRRTTITT